MSKSNNVLFDTDDSIKSQNTGLCCAQNSDNAQLDLRGTVTSHVVSNHTNTEACDDELFLQEAQHETPASSLTDRSLPENKTLEGVIYSDDISQISDDGMSVSSCASGFIPFSPVRPISNILYSYPSSSVISSKFDCLPMASSRSLIASPGSSPSISPGRIERAIGEQSSSLLSVGEACQSATSSPLTSTSDYNEKSPSLFTDRALHTADGPHERNNGIQSHLASPSDCVIKIVDQSDEQREKPAEERDLLVDKAGVGHLPASVSTEEDSLSPIHPAKRAVGQHLTCALTDRAGNNSQSSSTSSLGTAPTFSKWLTFRQSPENLGDLQLSGHCLNMARDYNCQPEAPLDHPSLRSGPVRRDMYPADGKSRLSLDESRRLRAFTAEMKIRQCGGSICRQAPTSASSSEDEGLVATALLDTIKQLRKEKENLANQYEREEEYLTNDLTKKLNRLREEKDELERTLEKQQESVVNKLLVKISKLERDIKLKQEALDGMRRERVDLENTLEQEQEALVNKLWKRMEKLEMEKRHLQDRLRRRDLQHPGQQERAVEAVSSSNQASLLTPCRCNHSSTQTMPDKSMDELHTLTKQVILLRAEVATLRKQIESYEKKLRQAADGAEIAAMADNGRLKRKLNSIVGKSEIGDGSGMLNLQHGDCASNRQCRTPETTVCSPLAHSSVDADVKPLAASSITEHQYDYLECTHETHEPRTLNIVGQEETDDPVDHEDDQAIDNANIP